MCLWGESPKWGQHGRAFLVSSAKRSLLEVSIQTSRTIVSCGWHIPTCFITCPKPSCLTGAIPLHRFQKTSCIFPWQAQHFGDLHRHFAWQACRVACFPNRIVRAASSGDNVQIPLQAWLFVTCAENWRKPRTKHRF